ncbi:MAG: radical SAM protein [Chitinivibrionales bacterium]|nr:radical SAM protein [Chitinivibrionales bacterium]
MGTIAAMLKKIRIGLAVLRTALTGEKRPLSVTFSVTDRCNLACAYCSFPERGSKELSTEQILALIREMAAAGTKRIGFVGGEPLLRNDIGALIAAARTAGMFVSLTTNGTLLRRRRNDLKNADMILVSLDGPQEVHDLTGKAAVNVLLADIAVLRQNNVAVCTSTVLTAPTIEHLDSLFKISADVRLPLAFQPYSYEYYLSVAKTKEGSLAPSPEMFKSAIKKIIQKKQDGALVANSYLYLDQIKEGVNARAQACLAGKRYCFVDTNGDVYPCSPVTGRLRAPNACALGFKEAFRQMPALSCKDGCLFPCYLEYNFLFSLSPRSIINVLKTIGIR